MKDKLFEIDSAMNMIKEEMIKDLSEAVSEQNKHSFYEDVSSNRLSFYENLKD